jgi:hypothetical protein
MQKYLWSLLNNQQVGMYTEYFVKMELTMYGFQVYGTEVDSRGIDFIARYENGPFLQVQVKSLRKTPNYVFMHKAKFALHEQNYLALGLLFEGKPPSLYLIPSTIWTMPNLVFVERNYEGLKSKPEWGLNISQKNLQVLEPFFFESTVERLIAQASGQ